MALITLADIETEARDYAQDNDATAGNWAITQAVQDRQINRFYFKLKQATDDRIRELTATASGLTVTIGNPYVTSSITSVRRILAVHLAASAGGATPTTGPLEHCKPHELDEWIRDYGATTAAPVRYAAWRIHSNATAADVGKWRFAVHPLPDTTYYLFLRAEQEVAALAAGSDKPDLTDEGMYDLACLVGAWMARTIGRSDAFVNAILSEVSESAASLADVIRSGRKPVRKADEGPL